MKNFDTYYKLNEDDSAGPDLSQILQGIDPNVKISEADYVIDPDGQLINMVKVRSIMGDAINQLCTMIDKGLSEYFRDMSIIYTYNNCKTFQTDGRRFAVNPTFFMNVYQAGVEKNGGDPGGGIAYIAFILLHECFHVMLGHCEDPRVLDLVYKGSLEKDRVNYAMDAVINWMIENSTIDTSGDEDEWVFRGITKEIGGVFSEKYSSMDWPEVYNNVEDEEVLDNMDAVIFKHIDPIPAEMEDKWYEGFIDGYNEVIETLRSKHLVESVNNIYGMSLLESQNDALTAILHAKDKTAEEKAALIYQLLGDDINGDEEAEEDDTDDNSGSTSSGGSSSGSSSSTMTQEEKDMLAMSEYEKGKIYGSTFAAYVFNNNGNAEYVKKHIFPDIELPDIPPMKKLKKDVMLNVGAFVDLASLTKELLKDKNVKTI